MSRLPRLLPLIGVAVAGVFAVNALAGARHLPDLIGAARAFAEAAPKAAKGTKAANIPAPAAAAAPTAAVVPPAAAMSQAPTALAPNADALCLASRAGLSPAEMKMIQDLQARRSQLDQREGDLDMQLKLVEAAEAKLNGKLNELNGLKGDISKLLGQVDDKQAAETARLVKVYSTMKPQQAAAALAVLTDDVRLPIVTSPAMKEAVLSAILNKMPTPAAKDLTEKMAQRFAATTSLTQARAATAPPGATPPPAAAAATPPAAQAAAPPAADKPAAKPKKVAAAAPKKKPAAKSDKAADGAAPMETKADPAATG